MLCAAQRTEQSSALLMSFQEKGKRKTPVVMPPGSENRVLESQIGLSSSFVIMRHLPV